MRPPPSRSCLTPSSLLQHHHHPAISPQGVGQLYLPPYDISTALHSHFLFRAPLTHFGGLSACTPYGLFKGLQSQQLRAPQLSHVDMMRQDCAEQGRIYYWHGQKPAAAKAAATRKNKRKKMKLTDQRSMANAHETGHSTDDVEGTTTEEEPERPSKVPRLGTIPEVAVCNKGQKPLKQHCTPTRSSLPPRNAPPMSPLNLDDFSSSPQQASELGRLDSDLVILAPLAAEIGEEKRSDNKVEREARELIPSTSPDTRSESLPSSPKRFFTEDGEYELMALALHRSRSTAKLEEMRRRFRPVVTEEGAAQPPEASTQSPSALNSTFHDDKVSHPSPPQEPTGPGASQESYGGEWVDNLAHELLDGVLHPAGDDSDLPR